MSVNSSELEILCITVENLYRLEGRGFPHRDCDKLYDQVGKQAQDLVPDLDLYTTYIAGYCSRGNRLVRLKGQELVDAKKTASKSFFEEYPQYASLKPLVTESFTPDLIRYLNSYEEMRVVLLKILDQLA